MGGWDDLLSISREARAEAQRAESEPPEACPTCGEPLAEKDGTLWCPFSGDHHYTWP